MPFKPTIKKLRYTIPTNGRVAIGEAVVDRKSGERQLVRYNHFRITAEHKRHGEWVSHPVTTAVSRDTGQEPAAITRIPIKLIVDRPDLSLRSRYEAWSYDDRSLVCSGDGAEAERNVNGQATREACPGADRCHFGGLYGCKLMTQFNFQIDVTQEAAEAANYVADELGTFIVRSSGRTTADRLTSKLNQLSARLGDRLADVPLNLLVLPKNSAVAGDETYYYLDVVLRGSIAEARAKLDQRTPAETDAIRALEEVIEAGLRNGHGADLSSHFEALEEFFDVGARTASFSDGAPRRVEMTSRPSTAPEGMKSSGSELHATRSNDQPAASFARDVAQCEGLIVPPAPGSPAAGFAELRSLIKATAQSAAAH